MCKWVNPDIVAWWNNNKNTINLWIKSFRSSCVISVTEYELVIFTPQLWKSHSASSSCIQSEVKVTAQNLSLVSGSLSCQRVTSSAASAMTSVGGTNCPAGLGLKTDGCVTARALSQESFILFSALFVHQVAFRRNRWPSATRCRPLILIQKNYSDGPLDASSDGIFHFTECFSGLNWTGLSQQELNKDRAGRDNVSAGRRREDRCSLKPHKYQSVLPVSSLTSTNDLTVRRENQIFFN